jgi:hypothetical protein
VQQVSPKEIVILTDNPSCETKQQIQSEFEKLAKYYCFDVPAILYKPYEYDRERKLKRVEKLC